MSTGIMVKKSTSIAIIKVTAKVRKTLFIFENWGVGLSVF
jgi:hypothetical protein